MHQLLHFSEKPSYFIGQRHFTLYWQCHGNYTQRSGGLWANYLHSKRRKSLDMTHQSFIASHADRQPPYHCISLCFKQNCKIQNKTRNDSKTAKMIRFQKVTEIKNRALE